MAPQKNRSH